MAAKQVHREISSLELITNALMGCLWTRYSWTVGAALIAGSTWLRATGIQRWRDGIARTASRPWSLCDRTDEPDRTSLARLALTLLHVNTPNLLFRSRKRKGSRAEKSAVAEEPSSEPTAKNYSSARRIAQHRGILRLPCGRFEQSDTGESCGVGMAERVSALIC